MSIEGRLRVRSRASHLRSVDKLLAKVRMHVVRAYDLHLWRCKKLEKLERHPNCNLHLGSSGRDDVSCQQLQNLPSASYPEYSHGKCDKLPFQSHLSQVHLSQVHF
jgi:hypothetical protein